MGRTTKEIRRRIERKEERLERKLTQEEIDKIARSVTRRVKRENTIRAIWLSMGLALGVGGHALLTSGEGKANQNNKQEVESEIDVNKKDEKITFKNGLVVTAEQLNEMNTEEGQLRKSIEEEIDKLETPQEVLDYLKNIYVEEYNNENEEKITPVQLKLYKNRADIEIYESTAKNGDKILRNKTSGGKMLESQTGVITIYIENETEREKQQITNINGKYVTLYSPIDKVEKYEDNCLVDVAEIMDTGIDWLVAMEQDANSYEIKEEYKNRLINAVTEYRTEKTNEIEEQER